jgi:hypothetical protein
LGEADIGGSRIAGGNIDIGEALDRKAVITGASGGLLERKQCRRFLLLSHRRKILLGFVSIFVLRSKCGKGAGY